MGTRRPDRVWIAGGLVISAAIAASGWFLLIAPETQARAESHQLLEDAQIQQSVLRNRLASLQEASQHTDELRAELAAATAGVPDRHDMEGLTRQLTAQAEATGVTISTISPGAPVALATPSENVTTTDTSEDPAEGTGDDSGSGPSLFGIDVTVVADGAIDQLRSFLATVEQTGPRLVLLTDATLTATEGDDWQLTARFQVFVSPGQDPAAPGIVPETGPDN